MSAQPIETTAVEATAPQHGAEVFVPLNQLKASPRNARKTPHSAGAIEALAHRRASSRLTKVSPI